MSKKQKNEYFMNGRSRQKLFLTALLLVSGLFGCGKRESFETFSASTEVVASEEETESDTVYEDNEDADTEQGAEKQAEKPAEKETCEPNIYVHVCGAVRSPGVYEMASGTRIFEVIQLAGGMTEDGCEEAVNQAMLLTDGQKLYIPTIEEWENSEEITEVLSGEEMAQTTDKVEQTDSLIDINKADKTQLCTLPGVGETRADAIISYREAVGAFQSIEDIMMVSGIKEGLFQKIKDRIKV